MKKAAIILLIILCMFSLYGCKPKAVEKPPLGVLPNEPEEVETGAVAQAYIDALDYAIRAYANRDYVKQTPTEYISFNVDAIALIPSQADRDAIAQFLSGYGLDFDKRGVNSGRSVAELQKGLEITVIPNPQTDFYEPGADLILEVRIYKGLEGRGYFASFKKYGNRYIMTYMYDGLHYPYR
ncbi:MAG TPA: hypothetical protein PLZ84_01105 [Clostridia bacterium]|nr:hypothetical protein [Clostridia bacterium]